MKKWLLVRTDRIGDLVCTLPVHTLLSQTSDSEPIELMWLISRRCHFIWENALLADDRFLSKESRVFFLEDESCLSLLKKEGFDGFIIFHASRTLIQKLWSLGIPRRIANGSKWFHWLFCNRIHRQNRRHSMKHELAYNAELFLRALEPVFGQDLAFMPLPLQFKLDEAQVNHVLKGFSLICNYIVIHPGMGGSAQNWHPNQYIELIQKLRQSLIFRTNSIRIVITGTHSDSLWLNPIKFFFDSLSAAEEGIQNCSVLWLSDHTLCGHDLLCVLKKASLVVAPSTGIAHLAASLGTPLVTLYPSKQTRAQSPTRWRPLGLGKITVLTSQTPSLDFLSISGETVFQTILSHFSD